MRISVQTVLLTVACVVSTYLWLELRAERRAAPLEAHATVPIGQESQKKSARTPEGPAQAVDAKSSQAIESLSTDRPTASNARVALLQDPEYRKARLAQIRANLVRRYPGLAAALGLSGLDAERLFDVLAEQQLKTNEALNKLGGKGLNREVEIEEATRIKEEGERQRDEALLGLLGKGGIDQWHAYQESLPSRAGAELMLKDVLTAGGWSISSTQLEPVVTAMAIEQARYEKKMKSAFQNTRGDDPQSVIRTQGELLDLREASNNRILDASARYLGPDQQEALKKSFEREIAVSRSRLRTYQKRYEAN